MWASWSVGGSVYFPISAVFSSMVHRVVNIVLFFCFCFYVNDKPESKFLYTVTIKLNYSFINIEI